MTLLKPSSSPAFEPSRDCEAFVFKIPQVVSEQELISMFEKYGTMFNIRLVSQSSKGKNYAFVRFTNKCDVSLAVLMWNGYEIRKGHRISVCRSIDNKCLVLCGIPKCMSVGDIYHLARLHTQGLIEVYVFPPRNSRGINSGLAFLKYDSHVCASIAKKELNSIKKNIWKQPVHIEWQTPGLLWDDLNCYGRYELAVGNPWIPCVTSRTYSSWSTSTYQHLPIDVFKPHYLRDFPDTHEGSFYGLQSKYA